MKKIYFILLITLFSCNSSDEDQTMAFPMTFVFSESVSSTKYQGYTGMDTVLSKIDVTGTRFERLNDTIFEYLESNDFVDEALYFYAFREFTLLNEERASFYVPDLDTTLLASYYRINEDFFIIDSTYLPPIDVFFSSQDPNREDLMFMPGVFYYIKRYNNGDEIISLDLFIDHKVEIDNFDENKLQSDNPKRLNERDTMMVYYVQFFFEKQ